MEILCGTSRLHQIRHAWTMHERYLINGYMDLRTQKVVEAQSYDDGEEWGTGYIPLCLPYDENLLGSCVVLTTRKCRKRGSKIMVTATAATQWTW